MDTAAKPWHLKLRDLMQFQVREILLVSSSFDAFIVEEEVPLTERLLSEYKELNLAWSPRIAHASNRAQAMQELSERHFDLVVVMPRLEDVDVATFGQAVKRLHPDLPVVLLTFTEAELSQLPSELEGIDHRFLWTGDTRILLAISKLVEDERNIAYDTMVVGVPVIIFVEDSVRACSTFLVELYTELMRQSRSLAAEGYNRVHQQMRTRARPKVVLARRFDEALEAFRRLSKHALAVITDVRFARAGQVDAEAGFALIEAVHAERPTLPILVQSAEATTAARADELGIEWVNKSDPDLLQRLRTFVATNLGFGDFVFRLPDGTRAGRARDLVDMEQMIDQVPLESFVYHAQRNDYSVWMTARSMFDLAELLRPKTLEDFGGPEQARGFVKTALRATRLREQAGLITDFGSRERSADSLLVRVGSGSIGGKARGIAFANLLLVREDLQQRFEKLPMRIPKTVVIGTGTFDLFLEQNGLQGLVAAPLSEAELNARFLASALPSELVADLALAFKDLAGPLAVRSSSLLEDLQFQPFAGVYATYMIPNNHPDAEVRFEELCRAIQAVYASVFSANARAYISATAFHHQEEKMAVVIQEMVGCERNGRFYPQISGVARSYNYYPVGGQKATDGTALVALGLGHIIVSGGTVMRFSPGSPQVLPQAQSPSSMQRSSQQYFYALDMTRPQVNFAAGPEASLMRGDLRMAEEDGTLALVASVYCAQDNVIRDNARLAGPRVLTFNNILKWQALPLASALEQLLEALGRGMGCAVEIEFAVDADATASGHAGHAATLYVLQVRPAAMPSRQENVDLSLLSDDEVLCRCDRALGHGVVTDMRDVVYVKRGGFAPERGRAIVEQVAQFNARLRAEGAPYLLVGPGRWGSSDARLGIPVEWKHIAGARVIAETPLEGRSVEPSLGSHFFHNITSLGLGYLTLGADTRGTTGAFIDLDWLDAQPAAGETAAIRHVRLAQPLRAHLDGRQSAAVILRPAAD